MLEEAVFPSLTGLDAFGSRSSPGFQSESSRWTPPRHTSSAEWCWAPGGSTYSWSKTSAAASSICPLGGGQKLYCFFAHWAWPHENIEGNQKMSWNLCPLKSRILCYSGLHLCKSAWKYFQLRAVKSTFWEVLKVNFQRSETRTKKVW